jgi:hypothetical protein
MLLENNLLERIGVLRSLKLYLKRELVGQSLNWEVVADLEKERKNNKRGD